MYRERLKGLLLVVSVVFLTLILPVLSMWNCSGANQNCFIDHQIAHFYAGFLQLLLATSMYTLGIPLIIYLLVALVLVVSAFIKITEEDIVIWKSIPIMATVLIFGLGAYGYVATDNTKQIPIHPLYWEGEDLVVLKQDRIIAIHNFEDTDQAEVIYETTSENIIVSPGLSCFSKRHWLVALFEVKHLEGGLSERRHKNLQIEMVNMTVNSSIEYDVFKFDQTEKCQNREHIDVINKAPSNNISLYDNSKNQYLRANVDMWSLNNDRSWPLTLRREQETDSGVNLLGTIELPSGPWNLPPLMSQEISSFSCGAGCYQYLKLYVANNSVFLHAYGQGVHPEGVGIFKFKASTQEWMRLTNQNIEQRLAITQDGCKIAYFKKELKLIELCAT